MVFEVMVLSTVIMRTSALSFTDFGQLIILSTHFSESNSVRNHFVPYLAQLFYKL